MEFERKKIVKDDSTAFTLISGEIKVAAVFAPDDDGTFGIAYYVDEQGKMQQVGDPLVFDEINDDSAWRSLEDLALQIIEDRALKEFIDDSRKS